MGGVEFSPNDFFSPNSQQRWIGLIMNDYNHTALGMPHLTGEKWSLVAEDIMISTRCATCNYGGNSLVKIYNTVSLVRAQLVLIRLFAFLVEDPAAVRMDFCGKHVFLLLTQFELVVFLPLFSLQLM